MLVESVISAIMLDSRAKYDHSTEIENKRTPSEQQCYHLLRNRLVSDIRLWDLKLTQGAIEAPTVGR